MNSQGKTLSVIKKNEYVLRIFAKGDPITTKYIICGADRQLLHCFVDGAHNIVEENIPLQLKRKERNLESIKSIKKKELSDKKQKQILLDGGFLPALLALILGTVIPSLA